MSPLPLLYVDDERNNRLVFQHSVGARLPVLIAESGFEVLERMTRERVCAVLTDHRMPGMSGVKLAHALRDRFPAIPRFLLTAYPDDAEILTAVSERVVDGLFTKPWNSDELTAFFSVLMGRKGERER